MVELKECEEEVVEVFVYNVDLAIEMLDNIKEHLKAIQNSAKVAFVKITGCLNLDTGEFSYKIHSINYKPKISNPIK